MCVLNAVLSNRNRSFRNQCSKLCTFANIDFDIWCYSLYNDHMLCCNGDRYWKLLSKIIAPHLHYGDVIMGAIASQITSLTIVYSIVYSDADQRKYQSSASLAFVRGIHRWPVNSPHKWPVTRKMFPFDDVIMWRAGIWRFGLRVTYHQMRCGRCQEIKPSSIHHATSWWRHQTELFSPLLALCEGNQPVTGGFTLLALCGESIGGGFPPKRPVITRKMFPCRDIIMNIPPVFPLQWRHNNIDGVSNHRRLHLLLKPFVEVQIKENIKAPRHRPFVGGIHRDRWIPTTKGQ